MLYTQLKFGWTPTEYANYSAVNSTRYAFGSFVLTTLYREVVPAAYDTCRNHNSQETKTFLKHKVKESSLGTTTWDAYGTCSIFQYFQDLHHLVLL